MKLTKREVVAQSDLARIVKVTRFGIFKSYISEWRSSTLYGFDQGYSYHENIEKIIANFAEKLTLDLNFGDKTQGLVDFSDGGYYTVRVTDNVYQGVFSFAYKCHG